MELVAISYSPWSERARWALSHHRLPYTERAYAPLVDEPWLRWRLGRLWAPVSVPVLLIPGGPPLTDSWDIGSYADAHGSGEPLFPERHREAIRLWAQQADRCLSAGRIRTSLQTRATPSAWVANMPPPLRGVPLSVAGAVVKLGVWHLLRKYGGNIQENQCEAEMRFFLLALREGLSRGGGFLVGGRLSWADLCAAGALQFVSPVDARWVPLAANARPCWVAPDLARGFGDLLAWRDDLYSRARPPSPHPALPPPG